MENLIYNFSSFNGEYLGSDDLEFDPIKGDPMLPAHSTLDAPMDDQLNKKQVRDDIQWNLVDDYRNQFYWLKATAEQVEFELGDSVDDTMTDLEPGEHEIWDDGGEDPGFWTPDPEYAREQKHDELRINAIDASKEPVAAIGFMWNGGEDSRTRMNDKATYMEQAGVTESISWDIDNTERTISDIDARSISNAITEQIESVGLHYRRKKNEYLACGDDTECIDSVVW